MLRLAAAALIAGATASTAGRPQSARGGATGSRAPGTPPPEAHPLLEPGARPTVLAFYMGDRGAPTYWVEFGWQIVTHVVCYGWNDPNMLSYAKARGVKVLQSFAGMCLHGECTSPVALNDSAVRATVVREAVRAYAPPPWGGAAANTSIDGLFFDIECLVQPCPWLEPLQAQGQASLLKEFKEAWPVGLLSLYVYGPPGVRISWKQPFGTELRRTLPYGYSAGQVALMEPHLDLIVFGGYASVNTSFLNANVIDGCVPTLRGTAAQLQRSCGGINPRLTVEYALNGSSGLAGASSAPCQLKPGVEAARPCAVQSWSAVVPKAKLVYAVGWFNSQHNIKNDSGVRPPPPYGYQPSFCQAAALAKAPGVERRLDDSGTWVFDRTDPAGLGYRVW
eukprot:SAG22_NODE_1133_length_5415_cov_2.124153_1_plen_392_part_10